MTPILDQFKMKKRTNIGIVFDDFDGKWTGGTYYILNLIRALLTLPDKEKPCLILFLKKMSDFYLIEELGYPYIKKASEIPHLNTLPSYSLVEKAINKLSELIQGRRLIDKRPTAKEIRFLFPLMEIDHPIPGEHFLYDYILEKVPKVYWIPDFQDRYYPHFFPSKTLEARKKNQESIAKSHHSLVLSSKDAEKDFRLFYPTARCKTIVLNFAVVHSDFVEVDSTPFKKNLLIHGSFFFSPNQFWQHKNHLVVLKAVKILKNEGIEPIVIFSGKPIDERNPDYFSSLVTYVEENDLGENIKFAGFLERNLQLKLMQEAIAVIQPSLFEGWSTVIEDAKSMNQWVIASALAVHKDQLTANAIFFDPNTPEDLSKKMKALWGHCPPKEQLNYADAITKFATDFLAIETFTS